ncbi:EamA family transporter, partial [Streptomyces sp. SID12501]|nr:EamA family transporter [Streptomyces sp. SID12501]
IGRLSATSVTLLGPLSPLTAAVIGWAALGQALSPVQLAGMAIAFGATVVGQLPGRRPRAPKETFSSAEDIDRNVSMDLGNAEVRR